MNFWQGKICPVCKIEFNEKDDVVYCPECGTAHHRACWNESGACFFAPEHKSGNFETINELAIPSNIHKSEQRVHETAIIDGTDENKQSVCGFCGYHNNPIFRICINCGHELSAPNPEFKSAPHYPPPPGSNASDDGTYVNNDDGKLVDDISRADMARFYGNNSEAAMGRLKQISQGKLAFSGGAFAGSFFWLLYHKVIGAGLAIALAVMSPILTLYGIICVKCADALMAATNTITDYDAYMTEQYRIINEFLLANMPTVNVCLTLTGILFLTSMVFCGFFGMKLYYNKAVKTIRLIRQRSYDRYQREYLFTVKGGVNFLAVLLPVALYFFASSLVAYVCLIFG